MELRIPYKILLLAWLFALPTKAQVPSENYVQTTERISDTESLTTTQYYDGLGRPYEKVEHGITPGGDNLLWLQQYDGIGREWKTWLPVRSASGYESISSIASAAKSQYKDSHAYSLINYDGSPLNRTSSVEGAGEEWTSHPVKTEYQVNTDQYPLKCKYYRVSMQGQLQDKGYYPGGKALCHEDHG